MTMDDDRDLRERFGALRAQDARGAPDFARLSRLPAPPRSPRWGALAWVGAVALVVLAVVLFRPWSSRAPRQNQLVPSITTWKSPTDFLLETPGRQLLRASPAVGRRWVEGPPL
jgi:hypothetical protein